MKIVILGSGNVATILGTALSKKGYEIIQVWSRDVKHAAALASLLHTAFTDSIEELDTSADLYIMAVSDDAIPVLSAQLGHLKGAVVHTSGSTPMDVLEGHTDGFGVFYPFQTFSKSREVNFKQIPILLEASNANLMSLLTEIASSISDRVQVCSSDQRKALHIAAVFACNFTNHLYFIAQQILEENQLDFDLLRPLIVETAQKVQEFMPDQVQTGPAVRNDLITVNSHIKQLENQPDLLKIYRLLSSRIISTASKD